LKQRDGTRRVFLAALGIASVAGLVVYLLVGYWTVSVYLLGRPLCDNTILVEAISPDKRHVASAFERGCGATTPFMRLVSIRSNGTQFDGEVRENWVLTVEGRPEIELAWTTADQLVVSHLAGGGRVVRKTTAWQEVTISYE
jgi:hypothetical protein